MKTRSLVTFLFVGVTALAAFGAEVKQKRSNLTDYPFWTSPKRGAVPAFVPGLNATLQLTEAQLEQITKARDEMANDAAVQAARGISKSDPGVTAEQRDKARATLDAASTRLREQVDAILTAEQKALIEKVNTAYAASVEEVGIVYADKFASVKADEAARRRIQEEKSQDTEEQFLHKLDGILNESQKAALARAGDEELQRSANAAATKKIVK
jgi:hypothetical protein